MRTLSEKGGLKRYRESQARIVLPMHKSIAPLDIKDKTKMVDFSAMISQFKPEPRLKTWVRRVVRVVTFFW